MTIVQAFHQAFCLERDLVDDTQGIKVEVLAHVQAKHVVTECSPDFAYGTAKRAGLYFDVWIPEVLVRDADVIQDICMVNPLYPRVFDISPEVNC